jgi:beta-phosphoglucomutase
VQWDIKGVIFDLDGVIVSTDEYHYLAWKKLADSEGIPFDRRINQRLRGVSRMASLAIILEKAPRRYTAKEKRVLAERKNATYLRLLERLNPSDILPGFSEVFSELKAKSIKAAIASSSRNAPKILKKIGLSREFHAVVDGNAISRSKPDPEVFLLAAEALGLPPRECLVVEDAAAGVEAALAGGMAVLAVGHAASDPRATLRAKDLSDVAIADILGCTS